MSPSFTKLVVSTRLPVTLAMCAVLLSACSGGSGSGSASQDSDSNDSNVSDVPTVPANDGAEQSTNNSVTAGDMNTGNMTGDSSSETVAGNLNDTSNIAPTDGLIETDSTLSESQPQTSDADVSDDSNPADGEASEPAPIVPSLTQVDFNITVPAYVSDSLQVQVTWDEVRLSASWVVDETWSASSEFPSDTESLLSVEFSDGNGALVLGSYETNFHTSTSPIQTVEVFAGQFDTARHDHDGDGMSNLEESIDGTDPLTPPPPDNTVQAYFDITVPVIVSDSLQVRLEWGDEVFFADWVGDENWSAIADFPVNAEETLTVTFLDRNGDLPLASYTVFYPTADNDTQNFLIWDGLFNTHRFDNDLDGVSNYREQLAGTDPLVSDSAVPVNFTSVAEKFTERCARCHNRFSNADGGLHETLLTVRSYVIPFEPEESWIVRKVEGSMYRYGGADMVDLLRTWILLGALEN